MPSLDKASPQPCENKVTILTLEPSAEYNRSQGSKINKFCYPIE